MGERIVYSGNRMKSICFFWTNSSSKDFEEGILTLNLVLIK
jgi:hypothetical protein